MRVIQLTLFLFLFVSVSQSTAQVKGVPPSTVVKPGPTESNRIIINWHRIETSSIGGQAVRFFSFEDAAYDAKKGLLPYLAVKKFFPSGFNEATCRIENPVFESMPASEVKDVAGVAHIGSSPQLDVFIRNGVNIRIYPLRKNGSTGAVEKLVSFDLKVSYFKKTISKASPVYRASYAPSSVLSSGRWLKIAVAADGIYKVTPAHLKAAGIEAGTYSPSNIRIYGNGGEMLSFSNADFFYDDLYENAIMVAGEYDGTFDSTDYVLFHGRSPHQWKYNASSKGFYRRMHEYSDTSYYFLTVDQGPGKRVQQAAAASGAANFISTGFDELQYHEKNLFNPMESGRVWLGESFEVSTQQQFSFTVPNIDESSPVTVFANVAARSSKSISESTRFTVASGPAVKTIKVKSTDLAGTIAPKYYSTLDSLSFNSSSPQITVSVDYEKTTGASAWLDYLEVIARRKLKMTGDQMFFRDRLSAEPGRITEFSLQSIIRPVLVWDVTDPLNPASVSLSSSGNSISFTSNTSELRQFVAFTQDNFLTPASFRKIENQNLHASEDADLIIIVHPSFKESAEDLAQFHRGRGLKVNVAPLNEIYNEFSSGAQDVSAIRQYARMVRTKAPERLKYLLLFGDGSYDNRSLSSTNSNFIPTYQTFESASPIDSYVSDDFYTFLADDADTSSADSIYVGVGRLPAKTPAEAKAMVDKIKGYSTAGNLKSWRNMLSFVADDQDGGLHMRDADEICETLHNSHPQYDIEKIYLDLYKQYAQAGGDRYPDVNAAIDNRVHKGALIINYTGHGNELGWAHENILNNSMIKSWQNNENLPLFVTATCEFSRFDDPGRTSAGENVLLNPAGGGIGLFTTVRVVFAHKNKTLSQNFYSIAFTPLPNGEMPAMGDIIRITKSRNFEVGKSFVLLGDPALKLNYPQDEVVTVTINQDSVTGTTIPPNIREVLIKALQKVTITGFVARNGQKLTDFNGIIYPTVFDKKAQLKTLRNDQAGGNKPVDDAPDMTFGLWKNGIYRGKASVKNGEFKFTFIVPKDIMYNVGMGRISYYAQNGTSDAHGYSYRLSVGGSDSSAPQDRSGPKVDLYMNDKSFVTGGLTNEKPFLIADVYDESGINTIGTSVGHDITSILDSKRDKPVILNDYYEAALDDYQRGTVKYRYSDLTPGRHTINFKVWDVYNNPADANTEFVVAESAKLALEHVLNYPNPFTTYTEFMFEHNHPGERLDVQVQVYTVSGKLIKTLETFSNSDGFRAEPIPWNGRDEFGDPIGRGVYVYRVKVKGADGSVAEKFEKLVILK